MTREELEHGARQFALSLAVQVACREPGLGVEERVLPLAREFEAYLKGEGRADGEE